MTDPTVPTQDDDEDLRAVIEEIEKADSIEDLEAVKARWAQALADREARLSDYPPTIPDGASLPAEPAPPTSTDDDDFALPGPAPAKDAPEQNGTTPIGTREPYEGMIPDRVIYAQMGKAFARARLLIHNIFGVVVTEGSNVEKVLIEEKPEVYADIVCRTAFTHFIAWKEGMNL